MSRPASRCRSTETQRFPQFCCAKYTGSPPTRGCAVRVRSPSGGSTLITSAPRSASALPHDGPDSTRDRSSTPTPASGRFACTAFGSYGASPRSAPGLLGWTDASIALTARARRSVGRVLEQRQLRRSAGVYRHHRGDDHDDPALHGHDADQAHAHRPEGRRQGPLRAGAHPGPLEREDRGTGRLLVPRPRRQRDESAPDRRLREAERQRQLHRRVPAGRAVAGVRWARRGISGERARSPTSRRCSTTSSGARASTGRACTRPASPTAAR